VPSGQTCLKAGQHTLGLIEGLSETTEETLGSMGAEVWLVTRVESLVWVDTNEEPRTTGELLASMGAEVWLVKRVDSLFDVDTEVSPRTMVAVRANIERKDGTRILMTVSMLMELSTLLMLGNR
jgi:hypothetical protein